MDIQNAVAEPQRAPAQPPHPTGTDDVQVARRRFLNVNRERLRRIASALSPRQRNFLDLLPLLFHVNHPALPGFIDEHTPHGLSEYSPGDRVLRRAARLAKGFSYKRRALKVIDVHALYLMGSSGTVAYSKRSDFDVWLCHRPDLDDSGRQRLQAKADAVTAWCNSLGLEAHFFLMSAVHFREGSVEALSSESSGSAQHCLLLDEFYRTGVLVAGRYPAWWLVPPQFEGSYVHFLKTLEKQGHAVANEVLDFGPVHRIPAEEFLGATLWQLFKGMGSPHKSVLKILLLEAYARHYPESDPLSLRMKREVYAGVTDIDRLDPYVMLHDRVSEYLESLGDAERLGLARRCFYFKTGERLSRPPPSRGEGWRPALLRQMAAGWGWTQPMLADLDARGRWKIDRVMQERQILVNALTYSYKFLSRFARQHSRGALVSERDMTILGRKLFAIFENKAGKIDIVNQDISRDVTEPAVSLHQMKTRDDQDYWLLYRDAPDNGAMGDALRLKRSWTLLEMIGWCHFNGIIDDNTRLHVRVDDARVSRREIRATETHLAEHFPPLMVHGASIDDLAASPRMLAATTVVNLGVDPLETYTREGVRLTTDNHDALSFGGWQENLVRVVDYLLVTSWREAITFKFHGMEGLMSCLCEHLRWTYRSGSEPRPVHAVCFTAGYGPGIARRVNELFEDVTAWFTAPGAGARRRYVLKGGARYYVLEAQNEVAQHDFTGSYTELVRYLGRPGGGPTSVSIDAHALEGGPLPAIYGSARESMVQFYYVRGARTASVFVLDEHGDLFHDEVPFHSQAALLGQYARFFESVQFRQNACTHGAGDDGGTPPVEFYQLARGRDRAYHLHRLEGDQSPRTREYFEVKVIGESVGGETVFTLYCGDREFSTLDHGNAVFEQVARHVRDRREGAGEYPIYITDIDLSRVPTEDAGGTLQTIHYLQYKRRIEERLNQALSER